MNTKTKIMAAGVLMTLAAAGCGTSTVTKTPTTPTPAQSTSGAPSPSPSERQQQAQVGDQFTVTAEDGTKYQVTLLKVVQNAQPASEFDAADAGHHLAAAQFRITATTTVDENANNNAAATGSDEQSYTPTFSSVTEGTNFANGAIRLHAGSSLAGWVTFELPDAVTVAKVSWTPMAGFSSQTAEWQVPSPASPPPSQTAGPAATVHAYFAAINTGDYQRAWSLGGRNTGQSYASFVAGHATTAKDTVTILSVSGDVVTARLTAAETDGTIKVYEGSYTVRNGVIVHFDVHQVS